MSQVRVLQFTSHNEDCGIAQYQEQFIEGMSQIRDFHSEYFPHSPYKTRAMSTSEFAKIVDQLSGEMKNFDILHIQHEVSFFRHSELQQMIDAVHKIGKKKVAITVHAAPEAQYKPPVLGGLGPKSMKAYAGQAVIARKFIKRYVEPLKSADLIIVHNTITKNSLVKFGVPAAKIKIIRIPVPKPVQADRSEEIKQALNRKKDDVIFCTIGFISESKGTLQAVKALSYLPENYKLAIIGGVHPEGEIESFLDIVTDEVARLGLKDRIYITGFVPDNSRLNGLINECSICVFPLDKKYYSYVSSASLNNAIANHKPVVAYPIETFMEVNKEIPFIEFTKSANYYELARAIRNIDLSKRKELSEQYAAHYSYDKEAKEFFKIYQELVSR